MKSSDIRLIHGEAIEEMRKLIAEGVKVDAIITDPPQEKTACKWDVIIPFDPMWECIRGIRKDRTPIVLFGNEPFSSMLRMSNLKEYKYDWYWNKKINGTFAIVKYRPGDIIENITVFGKGRINYFPIMTDAKKENIRPISNKSTPSDGVRIKQVFSHKDYDNKKRYPVNYYEYSKNNKECNPLNRIHINQKPVPLLEYLVKTYTKENDLILDFTMGSGSTGEACKNLNRRFIGIEQDREIF